MIYVEENDDIHTMMNASVFDTNTIYLSKPFIEQVHHHEAQPRFVKLFLYFFYKTRVYVFCHSITHFACIQGLELNLLFT